LHFSHLSNTLFRLEKQAARRSAKAPLIGALATAFNRMAAAQPA
jgi:hypothetical protein